MVYEVLSGLCPLRQLASSSGSTLKGLAEGQDLLHLQTVLLFFDASPATKAII